MDSKARIFVAGHQGPAGAAIMRRLVQEGYTNVIARDKSHLDLTDARMTDNFFRAERPEYAVVAAGLSGGIVENQRVPADFLHVNLSVAINILKAAHEHGVKKLIYLCSSCMYPSDCPQPMKEEQLLSGKPDASSLPTAIAKLAALQLCLSYNQQYGVKRFIPVIPNNTYGPDDDFGLSSGHVLAALIHRFHEAKRLGLPVIELWGSGTSKREFIHADDVASACLLLLKKPLEKQELPINIGTGEDYFINELAHMIAAAVGYTGKIAWDIKKPDGAPRKLLDSSRIRQLGWAPGIPLEQGIKETYQWYLAHAETTQRRAHDAS